MLLNLSPEGRRYLCWTSPSTYWAIQCWLRCFPCSRWICQGTVVDPMGMAELGRSTMNYKNLWSMSYWRPMWFPVSYVWLLEGISSFISLWQLQADFVALGVEGCAAVRRFVQSGDLAFVFHLKLYKWPHLKMISGCCTVHSSMGLKLALAWAVLMTSSWRSCVVKFFAGS